MKSSLASFRRWQWHLGGKLISPGTDLVNKYNCLLTSLRSRLKITYIVSFLSPLMCFCGNGRRAQSREQCEAQNVCRNCVKCLREAVLRIVETGRSFVQMK